MTNPSEGAKIHVDGSATATAAGTEEKTQVKPLPLKTSVLFSAASYGSGMFNGFFNTALPLFLARYDLPYLVVGLVAQERSFLGSFLEPVVGAVSDRTRSRFGRRRPYFLVGAPLAALFLVVVSREPPAWALVAILSLLPFLLAISLVPYRSMMADIATPPQRGRLGGTMSVMEMAGQVVIVLILAAIWSANEMLVFSIISLALVLGFALTFFAAEEPPLPAPATSPVPPKVTLRAYGEQLLVFRQAAKYVASQFVFWFGVGGVSPFLTRYAVSELGIAEQTAFLLFLLLVAATALCAVPAGWLGDRFGKKRLLAYGLLLFAAAALVGSQARTVEQLAVALVVVGIANGVVMALGFAFLTELLPRRRMGELTGLGNMTWSFAQPLGSAFAGFIADQTGTLRSVFLLTSLLLFLSFLILTTVKTDYPEAEAAPQPAG